MKLCSCRNSLLGPYQGCLHDSRLQDALGRFCCVLALLNSGTWAPYTPWQTTSVRLVSPLAAARALGQHGSASPPVTFAAMFLDVGAIYLRQSDVFIFQVPGMVCLLCWIILFAHFSFSFFISQKRYSVSSQYKGQH